MTQDELDNLERDARDIHYGMELRCREKVLLPYREYSYEVWAIEQTGPNSLDQIFFDLLKNGINTREKIARQLGVGGSEFIFTHLDILIRNGYIIESASSYSLTEQGKEFYSGNVQEERPIRIIFPFIWSDMTAQIVEKKNIEFSQNKEKRSRKIKHGEDPAEADIISSLAEDFNAKMEEDFNAKRCAEAKKIAFYDSNPCDVYHPYKERYAEYVALFYVYKKEKDNLFCIDLRVQDNSGKFHLCEELSEQASKNPSWYEEFEKIFTELIPKT